MLLGQWYVTAKLIKETKGPIMKLSKLETAMSLQSVVLAASTGGAMDAGGYASFRKELLTDSAVATLLPTFIRTNRDLSQFWSFIKTKFDNYKERREYIWSEFQPLLDSLEKPQGPADKSIETTILATDYKSVHEIWTKALERRDTDAEGAITMARTLLESTCKHILDAKEQTYDDKSDLPKLYTETAKSLNLAPDQHSEDIFKQILRSCSSIVQSLGNLRNKTGDAHGKGLNHVKPSARHAELAVNLAGAMASFLIQTHEFQKAKE